MKNAHVYHQPPEQNQECLVKKLRAVFVGYGLEKTMQENYDTHIDIVSANQKNQLVQRYHINRWLFEQLLYFPGDTVSVRLVIANDGPIDPWFTLISQRVVPFFIQNGMPKKLNVF